PNPESKLGWLIDKITTELELSGTGPAPAPARGDNDSWFPLRRYDLYILVPLLAGGFLISLLSTGDNKDWGLGISTIASFIYMIVIAVRNAGLNRSVLSGKSFASYLTLLVIGMSPALVIGASVEESISTFGGLIILSLLVAVITNVV